MDIYWRELILSDKDLMQQFDWYASLAKPEWAPPAWLFGPVWSVLYAIILVSFGYVAYSFWKKRLPGKVFLPFVLNIVFNLAFSPIQFGLQSNILAAIDISLVLATLIWALTAIYPRMRWVALVNIPYLLWVSFATVLQFTIKEMLSLGVFGGRYMTDCRSEFPSDWFASAKLCSEKHDPTLNCFGVNASQPLRVWREKGWIHRNDPRGWFQWYCRYFMGRRQPQEDERQIKRWLAISRHIAQVKKHCSPGDVSCRPRQRQALLHWAYDSRKI